LHLRGRQGRDYPYEIEKKGAFHGAGAEQKRYLTPQYDLPDLPQYHLPELPRCNTFHCHLREFHGARRGRRGKQRRKAAKRGRISTDYAD